MAVCARVYTARKPFARSGFTLAQLMGSSRQSCKWQQWSGDPEELSLMNRAEVKVEVDRSRNRFPYSIVWGPLGPLTCCCPCVGEHLYSPSSLSWPQPSYDETVCAV